MKKQHLPAKKPLFRLDASFFSFSIRSASATAVFTGGSLTSRRKSNHGNCKESDGEEGAGEESGSGEEGRREEDDGQEGRARQEGCCEEGGPGEEGDGREEGPRQEGSCEEGPREEAHPQCGVHEAADPGPVPGRGRRSAPLPRTEIVSKLWAYIKKNKLQDQQNKRMVNADDKLRALFGKGQVSMFEMAGLIGKHVK
jgi:upstream activation factor subunit UAF30